MLGVATEHQSTLANNMTEVRRSAIVPHSAEQMFELVNDIERYPEFLPWCTRATVHEREAESVRATLVLAKGPLHQQFSTRNTLIPGRSIEVYLVEGPFRHLYGRWRFDPIQGGGCQVTFRLDFEFKNKLIQHSFGRIFEHVANTLVKAFCERAREVFA
jgi:ribosome-associated toxin RatA of RatAB toxin-antitoxin module